MYHLSYVSHGKLEGTSKRFPMSGMREGFGPGGNGSFKALRERSFRTKSTHKRLQIAMKYIVVVCEKKAA